MQLLGFHHLTAVTANARRNFDFYTRVLGMRLVKRTVNQDDVSAYHLFYGDGTASPGSDLTFFAWPAAREKRGTGSVARTGLRVNAGSFDWWQARFSEFKVTHQVASERNGRGVLDFEDPEGQRLSLVADDTGAAAHLWQESAVPAEHQIHGLGCIMLSVPELARTARVLLEVMNMRATATYSLHHSTVHVFEMANGGAAAELHVAVEPELARAHPGAGGVHHLAYRVADTEYGEWRQRLDDLRVGNSGPIDRYYFRSLYFREPNGILFELATDGPGFAVDEPMEKLGRRLSLPSFLEARRAEIEAGLTSLD